MKYEEEPANEDAIKCPICEAAIVPGSEEYCPHWLCMTEGGDILDQPEFQEATEEFYSLVEQIDFEDEHKRLIAKAPKKQRELFETVQSEGTALYWTGYLGVKSLDYETDNTGIGFAGRYYFHPSPEEFVAAITEEAERGIEWLHEHIGSLE